MVDCEIQDHKVFTAGGGTDIVLREFVYKASQKGKVLYIQAGLHGGETSQWVLYKLHQFLKTNLVAGEVHVVPYANPLAWMQRTYFSTFGKFSLVDGKDFNRCFPGNPEGDVNSRIASVIMSLAKKSDFVVDLHTSKSSNPFAIYTKKEYEALVKACGFPYNQYSDDASIPSLHGTFNAALDREKVANITIECGGHNEYDEAKICSVYDALCSILLELKMVEKCESKKSLSVVYAFEKRKKVFSPMGGLFKSEQKLSAKVKQGDVLGYIYDAKNLDNVVEIKAPINGVLHVLGAGHIAWEGDVLAEIVPEDDLRVIAG